MYGVPIANGKTLVLEADDDVASVFAVTFDGLLSNELMLPRSQAAYKIELTAKGGWRQPSDPKLKLLEQTQRINGEKRKQGAGSQRTAPCC